VIYSSPLEDLKDHVKMSIDEWYKIDKKVTPSLSRLTELNSEEVKKAVKNMIVFHDVGKMTALWQYAILHRKETPPHAQLSAVYLWKNLNLEDSNLTDRLYYPITFATLIHHTGKSILTDNLERPDVIVIQSRLVNNKGEINWHDEAQLYIEHLSKLVYIKPIDLRDILVEDLRIMSRELRMWSLGNELRLNHRNRLIASAFHQVLKICDIRSAQRRGEWDEANQMPIVKKITEGGLVS